MQESPKRATIEASARLRQINQRSLEEFEKGRRILSFSEYFEEFVAHPHRFGRSAAQYVRDCFDSFGVVERDEATWGSRRHYRLFDCPFDNGRDRLVGQEMAQEAVYRALTSFVREGRIQRLIMLHGPNGSAKSSLISCIMRALEAYSRTDEGALYRFSWIFPTEKISRGSIGFGDDGKGSAAGSPLGTYAYLDELEIDAKVADVMRDNPLFLIPRDARAGLLSELGLKKPGDEWDGEGFASSDYLQRGDLSHMSKKIYEALLTAYNGDHEKVLRHVQVERFFISRRYRMGAITVEPQLRVDAGMRQITVDRSLQSLPASLQNQTLFEPYGDLVDANRGMIEYNDWLKRQPELNKYLLSTSEKGSAALEQTILFLDMVLIGSTNETYLEALKASPDYPSFKARLELVRMPYLLNYDTERQIYDEQIRKTEIRKTILPHTTFVAALWAVLTRLKRPRAESYPSTIREVVTELTPLQKAELYARGRVPETLDNATARELKAAVKDLLEEGAGTSRYEGRYGASPREMKMIILNASENPDYPHLSPLAIFEELRELVRDPTVYPWLQMEPDGPYRRPQDFIDIVTERYLDILDREVRQAMGLVEEEQYTEFFGRYVDNVTHWLRGEKILNSTTGNYEDADEKLMEEVEAMIAGGQEAKVFRDAIMMTIASWSIEHAGEKIVLNAIFANHLDALRQAFFEERKEQIGKIKEHLLLYINDQAGSLNAGDLEQVERTLGNMETSFEYTTDGAREAVMYLLRNRYS